MLPMRQRVPSALIVLACASAAMALAQQPTFNTNRQVTFVLRGGERHTGTLVYHNTADFNLIENGAEKAYPATDIALVDFGTGDPSADELRRLPRSDNPAELRSNMLVTKDGRFIHGKVYTIKTNAITIDAAQGGRQDVDLGNVSHLYMNTEAAKSVFAATLNAPPAPPAAAAPAPPPATAVNRPASGGAIGSVTVNANQAWTDTGITVKLGDRLAFSASGRISIRRESTERVGPDGSTTENRTGAPLPSIGVGGLIGRVGMGVPFAIGSHTDPIPMPGNGRLYLGVNDAGVSDNSGSFVVSIMR
jgi:hypothetical protein